MKADRILNNSYDQENDVMYVSLHFPALEADDTKRIGSTLIRLKDGEVIGITILDFRGSLGSANDV